MNDVPPSETFAKEYLQQATSLMNLQKFFGK
jgi:hypothetical protein